MQCGLSRCHSTRSRILLLTVLFVVLGVAADVTRAAPLAAGDDTWVGSWAIVGPEVRVQGSTNGLLPAADGTALAVAAGMEDGSFTTPIRDMGHRFMAVGAMWEAEVPDGASVRLAVRVSDDGASWGPWQALAVDDLAVEPGLFRSDLLLGWGRYVQLRADLARSTAGTAPLLTSLNLVAIDASAGPRADTARAAVAGAALDAPGVITRAGWGANESWMTWAPSYAPVQKIVVHHTTNSNALVESDPAAVVRLIYAYHALPKPSGQGWGDIGYNFMVDRQGRIYEGRYGGPGVIGGHALSYNRGTIGVGLLGDYSASTPPSAMISGLEQLLAWKCQAHGIDPHGSGWLYDRILPNIMGHRDCLPSTCPGERAYALLPQIRNGVASRLAVPPTLTVRNPKPSQWVAGVCRVDWESGPGTKQVTLAVDGVVHATLPGTATSWAWNSTSVADGSHSLRVSTSNSLGQSTSVDIPIKVDNTPPTGSMSAPTMATEAGVRLSLSCKGCTSMQFGRGWRWEGEDLSHQIGVLATDPAASNGKAWRARVGVDGWGAWYGPYFCGLPAPGDYEGVFWLRSGRNDLAGNVAEIDVSDSEGLRFMAGSQPLPANEFATTGRYQAFTLPFHYPGAGSTCGGKARDGLELRTWYQPDVADLWLDKVEIMTAPQSFASSVWFSLPEADGRYPVEVRFKDAAGNMSPVYAQTVTVDRTAPAWGQPDAAGLPVSDGLSGLASAGAYALSDDGIYWGAWTPVTLGAGGVVPAQASWAGRCVRARVQDVAGNTSYSPPIRWPEPASPDPKYVWWDSCGARVYLPYVAR